MKQIIFFIAAFFLAFAVYADDGKLKANAGGGGKVNNPWQPADPSQDICTAFLPEGLNLESCTELASTTSGKTYLCGTLDDYIVYCPE